MKHNSFSSEERFYCSLDIRVLSSILNIVSPGTTSQCIYNKSKTVQLKTVFFVRGYHTKESSSVNKHIFSVQFDCSFPPEKGSLKTEGEVIVDIQYNTVQCWIGIPKLFLKNNLGLF